MFLLDLSEYTHVDNQIVEKSIYFENGPAIILKSYPEGLHLSYTLYQTAV